MKIDKAKGLTAKELPVEYQRLLKSENMLAKKFVKNSESVLDVGCGNGRYIPSISPLVGRYVGIDINAGLVEKAKQITKKHQNATVFVLDANHLGKKFGKNSFEKTICLFNALGTMKNQINILKQMSKITKKDILLSFMEKGSLKTRKKYYEKLRVPYRIQKKTETIFSPIWGFNRAYSKTDIQKLAAQTGLVVNKAGVLKKIGLFVILSKKEK